MNNSYKKGFTLIEIMVAVSIFTIVMVVGMGALLTMNNASRRAGVERSVIDSLNFTLESMARQIRVGSTYHCTSAGSLEIAQNCFGGTFFAYEAFGGDPDTVQDQVIYRLDPVANAVERSVNGGSTWSTMTAPEVEVTNLQFYVTGSDPTDGFQPSVTITISGKSASNEEGTELHLQTAVTQRLLDVAGALL